jgi:glycosyltransferase involved in cell wall biosynthesis
MNTHGQDGDLSTQATVVSIVIPCYNREHLVAEAIESALRQGTGVEIIVVDDGSSDKSWHVIQGFGGRVRSFRIPNGGVSNARNVGVGHARGQFVRFLDSDDRIPDGVVQAHLDAARALPKHQIAFGDAVSIDISGNMIDGVAYGFAHLASPGPLPRAALLSGTMSPYLPMFPAEALRQSGGFDPALSLSEDVELALRLSRHGYEFVRVPIVVAEVREHEGGRLSRHFGAEGYRKLLDLYSYLLATFSEAASSLSLEEKRAFAKRIWTAGRNASREGHPTEAAGLFWLAKDLAGRQAWNGPLPLRAIYAFVPAYRAERMAMAVKSIRGRK